MADLSRKQNQFSQVHLNWIRNVMHYAIGRQSILTSLSQVFSDTNAMHDMYLLRKLLNNIYTICKIIPKQYTVEILFMRNLDIREAVYILYYFLQLTCNKWAFYYVFFWKRMVSNLSELRKVNLIWVAIETHKYSKGLCLIFLRSSGLIWPHFMNLPDCTIWKIRIILMA